MKLIRTASNQHGTFGVLIHDNIPFAVTLEPEDKNNQQGISCIPAGSYTAWRGFYHHGGYECFELRDVPGRSNIKIHKGNIEDDTEGCILVGEEFGELNGKPAILRSGKGFAELMGLMKDEDSFTLRIIDACALYAS